MKILRYTNLFLVLAVLIGIALFFSRYELFQVPRADGAMEPFAKRGRWFLLTRVRDAGQSLRRGDVVTYLDPMSSEDDMRMGRVVGLPGETVAVRNRSLFVGGSKMDESYLRDAAPEDFPEILVPRGRVFVLNDNRADVSDSRKYGPFPGVILRGRTR
ncbi:MAG: signal peptidase I [Planctomycetota bacterium]